MNWVNWIAFALNALVIALWVSTVRAETLVSCEPLGAADSISIAPDNAVSTECSAYIDEAGQNAEACSWQFAYRSDAAFEAFEATETVLDGCFNKTIPDDDGVNHPDSYNQIFYTTEENQISVSLKDKAQHQSTYLFLRIETAP